MQDCAATMAYLGLKGVIWHWHIMAILNPCPLLIASDNLRLGPLELQLWLGRLPLHP